MLSSSGRDYVRIGTLCDVFRLNAPFDNFKAWLYDYTANISNEQFWGEENGERYCVTLSQAKEHGDRMQELLNMTPLGKQALTNPEVAEKYGPSRPIQEFMLLGWFSHIYRLPIDAIYIKCIRLDDRRMNVSIYSNDSAVDTYCMQLANAMKVNWKWEPIAIEPEIPASDPSESHQTQLTWQERLVALASEREQRKIALPEGSKWVAIDFDGPERNIIGICWIDARAAKVSWTSFDWALHNILRAEFTQQTVNRWARPFRQNQGH